MKVSGAGTDGLTATGVAAGVVMFSYWIVLSSGYFPCCAHHRSSSHILIPAPKTNIVRFCSESVSDA